MLLTWERNCISVRCLRFCLLYSLLFLHCAREMFKGLPFYILCRNFSSLIIKRGWLQLHSLITSRLRIHYGRLCRTWSEGKTETNTLCISCIPTVFLSKPRWCVTEGGRTLLMLSKGGLYLLFLLAQPELWSDWLPLLRYAFGEKGLPLFHTFYPWMLNHGLSPCFSCSVLKYVHQNFQFGPRDFFLTVF